MSIQTTFSGYVRRYNGAEVMSQKRFSSTKTVTEYAQSRIKLASSHSAVSIMPSGLDKATSVFVESNGKINIALMGDKNASLDLLAGGNLFLNGSISDVQLKAAGVSVGSIEVFYDISG